MLLALVAMGLALTSPSPTPSSTPALTPDPYLSSTSAGVTAKAPTPRPGETPMPKLSREQKMRNLQRTGALYSSVRPKPTPAPPRPFDLSGWLNRNIIFVLVAVIALVLSIIPNFMAAANPAMFPFPGGTATAFLVLVLFHIIAAVVSVVVLFRMARK